MAHDTPARPEIALNLALAMVAASDAPLLLLDMNFGVVAASHSFCRAFGIDQARLRGRPVFELGDGEWNTPRLRSLLTATASGNAAVDDYEMDLKRKDQPVRSLALKAHRLDYAAEADVRILLTVIDITDVRENQRMKDELIHEKSVLLLELQHRVANSLQIIASVLLQSARKVQSDETRVHLHDAHHRVMSVAAVQRQLAASTHGDVELKPYFTQLCSSIGASMIADHTKLTLDVTVDGSIVPADVSVSLGLIVTELVINALKHAFPDNRSGKIAVDYHAHGSNWTLIVADDGIGMPTGDVKAKPGLGTSIVEALARQLHARVVMPDKGPGTQVHIVHTHIAVVADNDLQADRAI